MRAPGRATAAAAALLLTLPSGAHAGGAGRGPDRGSAAPATHAVEIRGMRFEPARLEVAPGDTVVWINRDVVPHTATAGDGSWDSGTLEQGERWARVVDGAGAGDYACRFHPTMEGRLAVDGGEASRGPAGSGGDR